MFVKVVDAIHVRCWHGLYYLTDGCDPICVFNKNRVSLYARARVPLQISFQFNHFIFFCRQKQITISFLFCRGFFYIFADEGGLTVMNVVQFPVPFHRTNVLSNNHPWSHTSYRCYCRYIAK